MGTKVETKPSCIQGQTLTSTQRGTFVSASSTIVNAGSSVSEAANELVDLEVAPAFSGAGEARRPFQCRFQPRRQALVSASGGTQAPFPAGPFPGVVQRRDDRGSVP